MERYCSWAPRICPKIIEQCMKQEEIFFFTNAARVWPLGHVPYRDRAARSDVVHLHICKDSVSEFTSKQPPSNVFMPDPGCEGWLLKKGKNSANLHNRQKTGKKRLEQGKIGLRRLIVWGTGMSSLTTYSRINSNNKLALRLSRILKY